MVRCSLRLHTRSFYGAAAQGSGGDQTIRLWPVGRRASGSRNRNDVCGYVLPVSFLFWCCSSLQASKPRAMDWWSGGPAHRVCRGPPEPPCSFATDYIPASESWDGCLAYLVFIRVHHYMSDGQQNFAVLKGEGMGMHLRKLGSSIDVKTCGNAQVLGISCF